MTVLKQYNTTTSAWEPIVSGVKGSAGDWSTAQTVTPKTSSYTVTNSDAGSIIVMSNSSVAVTITIDTGTALAVGQKIDFIGLGNAGTITFVASGVSIYATPGLKFRAVGSAATLVCIISGVYVLMGDLVA